MIMRICSKIKEWRAERKHKRDFEKELNEADLLSSNQMINMVRRELNLSKREARNKIRQAIANGELNPVVMPWQKR